MIGLFVVEMCAFEIGRWRVAWGRSVARVKVFVGRPPWMRSRAMILRGGPAGWCTTVEAFVFGAIRMANVFALLFFPVRGNVCYSNAC